MEHKFVVSLQDIKLSIPNPIKCAIKYSYGLFSNGEVSTEYFDVNPDEKQKIPVSGFNEFKISAEVKESEIKNFLE